MIEFNRNKFIGNMAEHGVTQKKLSEIIELAYIPTHKRVKGTLDFKLNEIVKYCNEVKEHPAIFFTETVAKMETPQ